eukprot:CAMPEP_0184724108 /NCGR_PEP_ID=MMETSP0314-20130426/26919_1 /TAXON_ID=38298 /ORGANISM="Rhodella maculata, Strain CCMP 736" /LENGTH=563 /DNA_ID=CAMNT_0027189031 /DNA_START=39 /DNA_END=1727 /DNA_ORIENTATION=-
MDSPHHSPASPIVSAPPSSLPPPHTPPPTRAPSTHSPGAAVRPRAVLPCRPSSYAYRLTLRPTPFDEYRIIHRLSRSTADSPSPGASHSATTSTPPRHSPQPTPSPPSNIALTKEGFTVFKSPEPVSSLVTHLTAPFFHGFYNLIILLLSACLFYLTLRNFGENGWKLSPSPDCPAIVVSELRFAALFSSKLAAFALILPTVTVQSLLAIATAPATSPTFLRISWAVIAAVHATSIVVLYVAGAVELMAAEVNPLLGAVLGVVLVIVSLKVHSYVATHLSIVDEVRAPGEPHPVASLAAAATQVKEADAVPHRGGRNDDAMSGTESDTQSDVPMIKAAAVIEDGYCDVRPGDFRAFIYFMFLAPTLVFEPVYPRNDRIRVGFVVWHTCAGLLISALIWVISGQFILPVLKVPRPTSAVAAATFHLIKIAIPSVLVWHLFFFAFFHFFLSAIAEIWRFGDRRFYTDWWNATTLDMFWRRWNLPVHEWCVRHVVTDSILHLHLSKSSAAIATFGLSALLHEFVFMVGFRVIRPYMFIAMVLQIPLIQLTRWKHFDHLRYGNMTMW